MDMNERTTNGGGQEIIGAVPGPDIHQGPGPYLMGAATLVGDDVFNHQAEFLGNIRELMLDMRSGKVSYAVLSFGGVLGFGEKLFAVPWAALTLNATDKCFHLNVEKARLHNAPGFDKRRWPNVADPVWQREVQSYYGTRPFPNDRRMT